MTAADPFCVCGCRKSSHQRAVNPETSIVTGACTSCPPLDPCRDFRPVPADAMVDCPRCGVAGAAFVRSDHCSECVRDYLAAYDVASALRQYHTTAQVAELLRRNDQQSMTIGVLLARHEASSKLVAVQDLTIAELKARIVSLEGS